MTAISPARTIGRPPHIARRGWLDALRFIVAAAVFRYGFDRPTRAWFNRPRDKASMARPCEIGFGQFMNSPICRCAAKD